MLKTSPCYMKLLIFFVVFESLCVTNFNRELPSVYPLVVEKLIFFKQDRYKVFYGGPIERGEKGVQWLMPILFEGDCHKTRAVYEIGFVNCDLSTADNADIFFVNTSDIDIKCKNVLSHNYSLFLSLISGEYMEGKYIIIRSSDVANIFFPDIFIASLHGQYCEEDKKEIAQFLHQQFQTKDYYIDLCMEESNKATIFYEDDNQIIYEPIKIMVNCESETHFFYVEKRIKKHDVWKLYYLISQEPLKNMDKKVFQKEPPLVRLDSGCVSGQIYNDESCDCLDQLHKALDELVCDNNTNSFIIHIPCHDGRGFGTAPKAETEIYKKGGKGRVHCTEPVDTISSAKLLYESNNYDIRSFDGAVSLLKDMGIETVLLLTDNISKVNALRMAGIQVIRKKTETHKATCMNHIDAKKNSDMYFSE